MFACIAGTREDPLPRLRILYVRRYSQMLKCLLLNPKNKRDIPLKTDLTFTFQECLLEDFYVRNRTRLAPFEEKSFEQR